MNRNLVSPAGIFVWSIVGILAMAAIFGNGFIIAVSGNQWLQNRKMVPTDFFLTSLSISRLFLHLSFVLNYVLEVSMGDLYIHTYTEEVLNFTWVFSDMVGLCCASWFSVFCCVKVTNFANRFFLWLKPRINVLSVRLLGVSISCCMVISVPYFSDYVGHKKKCNLTRSLPVNFSQSKVCKPAFVIFRPFHAISAFINFTISMTATILLLISLWKHTRNLKKSSVGFKDLSMQIHINVMKPLLIYVFFYFLYFAGMLIYSRDLVNSANALELVTDILLTIFSTAHTTILLLTNPKLKALAARTLNIRQRAS